MCLASYSPRTTTTNQPINRAPMSRQGLTKNEQECQFLAKFGHFWAKKSLFLLEKSKVLLPTLRKTYLGTLFALFLDALASLKTMLDIK